MIGVAFLLCEAGAPYWEHKPSHFRIVVREVRVRDAVVRLLKAGLKLYQIREINGRRPNKVRGLQEHLKDTVLMGQFGFCGFCGAWIEEMVPREGDEHPCCPHCQGV